MPAPRKFASGVISRPRISKNLPANERTLAVAFTGCLVHGFGTVEELVQIVSPEAIKTMLQADIALCRRLLQVLRFSQVEAVSDVFAQTVAMLAIENRKLNVDQLLQSIPPETWVTKFSHTRLWRFVTESSWWALPGEDPQRESSRSHMRGIISTAHETRLMSSEELLTTLGGREELQTRANRAGTLELERLLKRVPPLSATQTCCVLLPKLTQLYETDELYLRVIVPLTNKCCWNEEAPTRPDQQPLPEAAQQKTA